MGATKGREYIGTYHGRNETGDRQGEDATETKYGSKMTNSSKGAMGHTEISPPKGHWGGKNTTHQKQQGNDQDRGYRADREYLQGGSKRSVAFQGHGKQTRGAEKVEKMNKEESHQECAGAEKH